MNGLTKDWCKLLTVCSLLVNAQTGWADMLDTSTMQPWEVCGMCHGLEGYSPVEKFPILAGQREAYIVKQLNDFQQMKRSNDGGQMQGILEQITENDLHIVAAYFSEQKRPGVELSLMDRRLWEQGKQLYQSARTGAQACADCHGFNNETGATASPVPTLFGQHRAYLSKQLKDFKSELRSNDDNALMRSASAGLSEQDINALAEYLYFGEQDNIVR